MPYKTTKDLPTGVRDLPKAAQEVWQEAYRTEWDACADEQRCHKSAWAAVKQQFVKAGGKWKPLPERTAEAFAFEPMRVMCLAEADAILSEVAEDAWAMEEDLGEADAPRHLIATLIEAGDNKSGTRRYTPEFLKQCIAEGRFTGSYGYANHPTSTEARERPERDMRYLAARTGEAFWDPQVGKFGAVRAPLVWLAEEHPSSMGGLASALFADPVVRQRSGLSIYYQGPVQVEEADVPGSKRRIQIPKSLGDSRKFDVDIVTHPGAGGSLPLIEAERPDTEEVTTMTLEEMKAQHPDLVAQLREEFEAEAAELAPVEDGATETEPQAAPEPEPAAEVAPEVPVVEAAEVDAPKPEPTGDGTEALLREVAELKSWRMLEDALRAEPVDANIREAARKALAVNVYPTAEAFQAAFRATVDGLKEVASQAAGPRVADLGGAPPAESGKYTLGDLTDKKEAK